MKMVVGKPIISGVGERSLLKNYRKGQALCMDMALYMINTMPL